MSRNTYKKLSILLILYGLTASEIWFLVQWKVKFGFQFQGGGGRRVHLWSPFCYTKVHVALPLPPPCKKKPFWHFLPARFSCSKGESVQLNVVKGYCASYEYYILTNTSTLNSLFAFIFIGTGPSRKAGNHDV